MVVVSPTISISTSEALPSCPPWMQKMGEIAIKRDLERLQEQLKKLAERKGCTLAAPSGYSVQPEPRML